MSEILGLGHDVVDVDAFSQQWHEPSSTIRKLFSVRELRQCTMRAALKHDDEFLHAAARWAGKESVIKAWSEAIADGTAPFTIESVPWSDIEILDDSRGRPQAILGESLAQSLTSSIAAQRPLTWHISLSHDGSIASAVAILVCLSGHEGADV
ncbi:MAG: holo-ACP synthase [Bifidobacterium aquikefiri]|uniref:Holo-[acyl-carrier-protein] synthase n=1 Tax=Bifidobacterium aquikefiri TaxID=1653207 RepID=A0A261G983_9BIFI|nr:holo-ACP synthase [Bifidobacterium aquikefiri]OZG67982.1 holo-[acyl-carrier protein] synthase [Bifidobacterium aquikefiri]